MRRQAVGTGVGVGKVRDSDSGILFRLLNRAVCAVEATALRALKVFCDCWLLSQRVYRVSSARVIGARVIGAGLAVRGRQA